MSQLMTKVYGKPYTVLKFFKKRGTISIYEDRIVDKYFAEDGVKKDTIILKDVLSLTVSHFHPTPRTIISFAKDGTSLVTEWFGKDYPGLSTAIEKLLQTKWKHLVQEAPTSNAVKWLIACISPYRLDQGSDIHAYAGHLVTPLSALCARTLLARYWNITDAEILEETLNRLLGGSHQGRFTQWLAEVEEGVVLAGNRQSIITEITDKCGENGIWAWDLVRAIHVSIDGFLAGYVSYENSLSFALQSGTRLQQLFSNWSEMFTSYLLGYRYWSGKEAGNRRETYYRRLEESPDSPFKLGWNTDLKGELV